MKFVILSLPKDPPPVYFGFRKTEWVRAKILRRFAPPDDSEKQIIKSTPLQIQEESL